MKSESPVTIAFANRCVDKPLFRHFPRFAGAAVALFGLLIVVSWHAHWHLILQMVPNTVPMQYNTALCFILSGAGLFLLTTTHAKFAPWLAGGVVVFTLLTLLEYLTGRNFVIDLIFFIPWFEVNRLYPGRMSPLTAVCFIFIGAGIVLVSAKKRWPHRLTAVGMLTCMVGVIVVVALFGYIFGIEAAIGWGAYTRMAVNTAVTFLLLSSALLIWSWQMARREDFNFLRWLPVTGSVTLMAMITSVSIISFNQLKNSADWRKHSFEVLAEAQTLLGDIFDTQRGMRGYVLTGQANPLQVYEDGAHNAPRHLARLGVNTRDNPAQQERVKIIASDLTDLFAYSQRLMGSRNTQGLQGAVQMESTGEGFAITKRTLADLETFTDAERLLLNERSAITEANFHNMARLLIFGSVLAAVLLVLANFMASLEVKRRLRAEEVLRGLNVQLAKTSMLQNAILGSANFAIISTTVEGVVTTFNSTAERWLGYAAAEVVGKLTPALWHDANEVMARAQVLSRELGRTIEPSFEVFAAKARFWQVDENEWTLIRKDGSRFPVSLSATALVDEAGAITGFLGVIADVTERKRATTALQESKRFLQSTLDALSSHIAILDELGTIIEVNAAWSRFASENHFLGGHCGVGENYLKVCDSVLGSFSEEAPAVAIGIRAIMAGQSEEFHLEYPCHSPREQRWFIVRATRFGGDGSVRVVVAHENITERKLLEAEREKLIGELQTALAEVKNLSGMIPICGWCKSVRNDQGYWSTVEQYVRSHSEATFSHGMCPECAEKFKADILKANAKQAA